MMLVSGAILAQSEEIVSKIINDMCGRQGFDGMWNGTDEDIQKEIQQTWVNIVCACLIGTRWQK